MKPPLWAVPSAPGAEATASGVARACGTHTYRTMDETGEKPGVTMPPRHPLLAQSPMRRCRTPLRGPFSTLFLHSRWSDGFSARRHLENDSELARIGHGPCRPGSVRLPLPIKSHAKSCAGVGMKPPPDPPAARAACRITLQPWLIDAGQWPGRNGDHSTPPPP